MSVDNESPLQSQITHIQTLSQKADIGVATLVTIKNSITELANQLADQGDVKNQQRMNLLAQKVDGIIWLKKSPLIVRRVMAAFFSHFRTKSVLGEVQAQMGKLQTDWKSFEKQLPADGMKAIKLGVEKRNKDIVLPWIGKAFQDPNYAKNRVALAKAIADLSGQMNNEDYQVLYKNFSKENLQELNAIFQDPKNASWDNCEIVRRETAFAQTKKSLDDETAPIASFKNIHGVDRQIDFICDVVQKGRIELAIQLIEVLPPGKQEKIINRLEKENGRNTIVSIVDRFVSIVDRFFKAFLLKAPALRKDLFEKLLPRSKAEVILELIRSEQVDRAASYLQGSSSKSEDVQAVFTFVNSLLDQQTPDVDGAMLLLDFLQTFKHLDKLAAKDKTSLQTKLQKSLERENNGFSSIALSIAREVEKINPEIFSRLDPKSDLAQALTRGKVLSLQDCKEIRQYLVNIKGLTSEKPAQKELFRHQLNQSLEQNLPENLQVDASKIDEVIEKIDEFIKKFGLESKEQALDWLIKGLGE